MKPPECKVVSLPPYGTYPECGYGCGGPVIQSTCDNPSIFSLIYEKYGKKYSKLSKDILPEKFKIDLPFGVEQYVSFYDLPHDVSKELKDKAFLSQFTEEHKEIFEKSAAEWIASVKKTPDPSLQVHYGCIHGIDEIESEYVGPRSMYAVTHGKYSHSYHFDWPSPEAVVGLLLRCKYFVIGKPAKPHVHGN